MILLPFTRRAKVTKAKARYIAALREVEAARLRGDTRRQHAAELALIRANAGLMAAELGR